MPILILTLDPEYKKKKIFSGEVTWIPKSKFLSDPVGKLQIFLDGMIENNFELLTLDRDVERKFLIKNYDISFVYSGRRKELIQGKLEDVFIFQYNVPIKYIKGI